MESINGDVPAVEVHGPTPSAPDVERPLIPPPVVVEIQSRIEMSRLIDAYLFPQESGPEFERIRGFMGQCSKMEWNRPRGCDCSSTLKIQGINSRDEAAFELDGPEQLMYLCQCASSKKIWSFSYQSNPILSFSWRSVLCSPLCGSELNTIEVFIPGSVEPIGKLEYMTTSFAKNTVTITNYVTNETFTASPARNSHPNCPSMVIKDNTGKTIALSGVHSARLYRGITTYMGINVVFPDIGMAATTKAILMAFGTVWQMDHQQRNGRCYILSYFIIFLIFLGVILFTSHVIVS